MESKTRTCVKALSWQALGLLTTSMFAWLYTGSIGNALSLALTTAASGMIFFVIHERIWDLVRWGRGERGSARVEGGIEA
ncbi:MAG: hypothetical protein CML31_04640 [Rhizobiales bacterium]|nr:hypothetical protein [Hoeflea sp.]MBG19237.1 hypothetical protein [Hyphomicrobiales bacterium]|tara:strand:- start:15819 stop:16058 length:240 start_codon:yes stop_codon:yes gene_type:complete